jgi:hypothetical protein
MSLFTKIGYDGRNFSLILKTIITVEWNRNGSIYYRLYGQSCRISGVGGLWLSLEERGVKRRKEYPFIHKV